MRQECIVSDLIEDREDPEDPPDSDFSEDIRAAGFEYSLTLVNLANAGSDLGVPDEDGSPTQIARHAATTVGVKATRIAAMVWLDNFWEPDGKCASDMHLTLLLIERLDEIAVEAAWFIAAATGEPPDPFLEVRAGFLELLRPLFDDIPAEARAEVDSLIRSRRAPSPFCTIASVS